MRMKKRVLAMLMVVSLIAGMLPQTAFATEGAAIGTSGLCEHHTHDETCGYIAAVEGHDCHYECAECAAPVCSCGTDDESIHATDCPAYAAPENPECYCREKCTEDNINVWCDVCGVQGVDACKAAGTPDAFETGYDLYVGGTQVTSDNLTITDGADGMATYDPDTNTLTLTNYTYSGVGYSWNDGYATCGAAIYYGGTGTLKLELCGTSSVCQQSDETLLSDSYGIYSNSSIEVFGSGSLTANGGEATMRSVGVYVFNDITITSGSLTGTSSSSCSLSKGVAAGNITVSGSGSLIGTSDSTGVQADNITVSGSGSLTGIGGSTRSTGVFAGNITVSDSGSLTAEGKNYGVNGGGDITVNGGSLTVNGGRGVCVYGDIAINGGEVVVQGYSAFYGYSSFRCGEGYYRNADDGAFSLWTEGSLPEGGYFSFVGTDHVTAVHEDGVHKISCNDEDCGLKLKNAETDCPVDYIYTGNKNTITVSCRTDGCGYSKTASISAEDKTYDGTAVEATVSCSDNWTGNGNLAITYTKDGEVLTEAPQNAGSYTASITYEGVTAFVTVEVAAKELTVTQAEADSRSYKKDDNTVKITGITLAGIVPGDKVSVNLNGVYGTLSSENAGTYTSVTLPELVLDGADKENYILIQPTEAVSTNVEIDKQNAEILADTLSYEKTYGDAEFSLGVTDTNTDADVVYAITTGSDVVSVTDGKVSILKAGNAEISISLAESTNYHAADGKTVTITVNKALNAPNMPGNTMSVPYSNKTVSAVTLPDGWAWQDADKNTALEVGVSVNATAVYTGTDKGNYENEIVVIAITRSACEHGNTEVKDVEEATCEHTGYTGDTHCKDCGVKLESGHATDKLGHDYRSEVTKEPTTTEEGVRTYTCANCKDTYTESVPKLPEAHKHDYTSSVTKEPSCTEKGVRTYTCSCGDSYTEPIAKTNHDYTSKVTKEPTTTEEGVRTYTCANCKDTYTESIPKLPEDHKHDYTSSVTKEPSCTESGVRTYTCSCGDSYTEPIAKTEHNYTSEVTKEPTTTEEGVRTYTCANCKDTYTESIPKLPEDHKHDYTSSVTKEPSCTENGVRTYTCSCGDSYTEPIAKTEHDYTSKVTKNPTTTEEGVMTYTCSACGHTYTKAIDKITDADSDNNEDNKPDTGKPFIKDDKGKESWDVIRDEVEDAKDGDTVTVDMNGATVVPGDVFDDIKGRDVTIVFDMGNGITWSVNGKNITSGNVGDIDFGVKVGADANNIIPVDVINKVTGERYSMNISLSYDGEFGFKAVLSLNLDVKNAGLFANLYYFDETKNELEFICADEIAADGTAELAFTHASEYIIVIDENKMAETPDTDSSEESEMPTSPPTGNTTEKIWNGWWLVLIGVVMWIIRKTKSTIK